MSFVDFYDFVHDGKGSKMLKCSVLKQGRVRPKNDLSAFFRKYGLEIFFWYNGNRQLLFKGTE